MADSQSRIAALEAALAAREAEVGDLRRRLLKLGHLAAVGEATPAVVHELNQPIHVLAGYLELLREGGLPEPSRPRAWEVMGRAVDRINALVRNLRGYSRPGGTGKTRVDLREMALLTLDLVPSSLRRDLTVEGPPGV